MQFLVQIHVHIYACVFRNKIFLHEYIYLCGKEEGRREKEGERRKERGSRRKKRSTY